MSDVIDLARNLIDRPSITPKDAGCQTLLAERLKKLGFTIESMPFGDVQNLWARRGQSSPVFMFAGHTDVVPPGPLAQWQSDPFQSSIRDGYLYGRGAADMKSGIAAMVVAYENFVEKHPDHEGSMAFLITSDEEGPSVDGTVKVVEALKQRGEEIHYCLIGEASSVNQLGDTLKIGRRGSLHGELTLHGKQGHIAYPHLAQNPIHLAGPVIAALSQHTWDEGNEHFQPTSFQIYEVHGSAGAGNVIPGTCHIGFNFRYAPVSTVESLQSQMKTLLDAHTISYDIDWCPSGEPFLSPQGEFIPTCSRVIQSLTGIEPTLSTSGGTSDGRFIKDLGCELVEMGPINETIHQINECVNIKDLETLAKLYENILESLFQHQ